MLCKGRRRAHHKQPLILHLSVNLVQVKTQKATKIWMAMKGKKRNQKEYTNESQRVIDVLVGFFLPEMCSWLVKAWWAAAPALQIILQWDSLLNAAHGEWVILHIKQCKVKMRLQIWTRTCFVVQHVWFFCSINLQPCPFCYFIIPLEELHNLWTRTETEFNLCFIWKDKV